MSLHSLKSRLNDKKVCLFKGKIAKSYITFSESKPNFKNIQIGVSSFEVSKYEILPARRAKKQTQYKPKTKPITKRLKMNVNIFYAEEYNDETYLLFPRTNPVQTQYKPSQIYPRMSHSGTRFPHSPLILSCPGMKRPDMTDCLAVKFLPRLRKKYFGFYLTDVSGRAIFLFSVFLVLIYIFLEVNQWSRKSN
jgi:hypothetical protein